MKVSREDVESYLTAISTWKSLCVKYPATVPMNVELNVTTSLDALNGIEQVLEDRLKQMDVDKHIKDMQDIYELRGTCYDSMQQLADKYNELKTIAEELKLVIDVERTWSETQKQLHEIELKDFKKVCDLADEMYEALKSASSYISQNNPHWSAPYHNETTREIIETISKYEQLKENEK